MSTIETLSEVFRTVFDDETIQLRPSITVNDVDGWDSLSHVLLILSIENRFKIKFNQKELLTFKNVGDLISSIDSKIDP